MAVKNNTRSAESKIEVISKHVLHSIPGRCGKLSQSVHQIIQRPRVESKDRRCNKRVQVAAGEVEKIQTPHYGHWNINYLTSIIPVSSSVIATLRQDIKRCEVHFMMKGNGVM